MHDIKTIIVVIAKNFWTFLEEYFYNGVIAGAVVVFFYCINLLCKVIWVRDINRKFLFSACVKLPFVALLGFYCYLILGITVLSRSRGAVYILKLVPFSTWGTDIGNLTFWIENILMMIPLSILLYILWMPFRRLRWSLFAGFLCSLSIECIQLFTRLGKFEIDDIMNNMVGMLLGFWSCKVIDRVFNR